MIVVIFMKPSSRWVASEQVLNLTIQNAAAPIPCGMPSCGMHGWYR